MSGQWTTTTPDPELFGKTCKKDQGPTEAPRSDDAGGCSTAPANPNQAQAPQQPGGGGAPRTGSVPSALPPAPGEGATSGP